MEELIQKVHNDILILRSIERLLTERKFDIAWNHANPIQRKEVEQYVAERNKDKIYYWIRKIVYQAKEIEEYSLRELRLVAKGYQVPNYSNLCREQLIREIYERKRHRKSIISMQI